MSSGVSVVFQECAGCHKSFKRLATHIAQSPTCEQVYATCQEDIPPDAAWRKQYVDATLLNKESEMGFLHLVAPYYYWCSDLQ
jgi:hypothetical protein